MIWHRDGRAFSADEQADAAWAIKVMERLSLDALQRMNAATKNAPRGNANWLRAFAAWRKATA